jgi:monodechloroaminopyrrolnitrin synthase
VNPVGSPASPPGQAVPAHALTELKTQAHRAAQLDPYALDTYFAHPRWTEPHAVRRALATVRPLPDDPALALAALRDIHMLMCALERDRPGRTLPEHPWLEPLLIHLGDVAGHVPCGGNACYGWANPEPPRTRTYTRDPREPVLCWGLGHGESRLDDLLAALAAATAAWPGPKVGDELRRAVDAWAPMVDAVRAMHRHDVADFVGHQLAPWLSHSFTIGGRLCRGPTAAQLPVVLIDYLLWGYDVDDPEYREYAAFYIAEQPRARRAVVTTALQALGSRSLVTAAVDDGINAEACEALALLLRRMYGFRRSHRRLADVSLPVRGPGGQSWGTGQFDPTVLDRLLAHTAQARARVAQP